METDYIITKVPLVTIKPKCMCMCVHMYVCTYVHTYVCDHPCEKGHICTSGGNDVFSITLRDCFIE